MSLRTTAEADLGKILEDSTSGFGWPITITDPAGTSKSLTGFSNDISQIIDPDTGQAVSGRLASVALVISSLTAAGLGLPVGIADSGNKPWIIQFNDLSGNVYKFKVSKSNPDRTIGMVTCLLELYKIDPLTGASFDGAAYLSRDADLTGIADGKKGTIAVRFKFNGRDNLSRTILSNTFALFSLGCGINNKLGVLGFSPGWATTPLSLYSAMDIVVANGYVNALISWDVEAGISYFYIDDIDDKGATILLNDNIEYTRDDWWIGAADATPNMPGDINFLYFDPVLTNFSIEANRRKFFSKNGSVVISSSGDGSEITGNKPLLYHAGDYTQWEINKGSGGGFTKTGVLTKPLP